jgi:hypothetical protein
VGAEIPAAPINTVVSFVTLLKSVAFTLTVRLVIVFASAGIRNFAENAPVLGLNVKF